MDKRNYFAQNFFSNIRAVFANGVYEYSRKEFCSDECANEQEAELRNELNAHFFQKINNELSFFDQRNACIVNCDQALFI